MFKIRCDLHLHTNHSSDSREILENYCKRAIALGVDCLCFTEHADHNPKDPGFGFYDAGAFFEELRIARQTYGGRLKLLAGIEFSEPHLYKAGLESYAKLPYDFILGSIHFWGDDLFPSDMIRRGIPAEKCFEEYWPEVLKAVKSGGFDCVGHLDFPKRYYRELSYDRELLAEICTEMVKRDIILEVNTSSLRAGLDEAMPNADMLGIYKKCGGRYFTMGSDAHSAKDLYTFVDQARKVPLELGLEEVYFEAREMLKV